MAATLTLYQERVNLGGTAGYRVINTVSASSGIPKELFVFSGSDNIFSHVATLQDFAYPVTNISGYDFYRLDTATKDFPDVETALEFANHVKFRIDELLRYYNEDFASFPGNESTAFPRP